MMEVKQAYPQLPKSPAVHLGRNKHVELEAAASFRLCELSLYFLKRGVSFLLIFVKIKLCGIGRDCLFQ